MEECRAVVLLQECFVAIVGGFSDRYSVGSMEVYDTKSKSMLGSVATNPSLCIPRCGCFATVVGDTKYVVGCRDGQGKVIETMSVVDRLAGLQRRSTLGSKV